MEELMIYDEINMAKKDKGVLLELITKFTPLLKKYTAMLMYEDAYDDLQMDYIELVYKFDIDNMEKTDNNTMLSYIKKTLHNQYMKRSKRNMEYCTYNTFFSEMSDEQFAILSGQLSVKDNFDALNFKEYKKFLTKQEFQVILLIYYYGYAVNEIAGKKKISRQAVNQIKIRALSKIRKNCF